MVESIGKVDEYTAGRMQGLLQARDIVRSGGLEELEKEIEFRNITKLNTVLNRKQLDQACIKIKNMTLDTMLVIGVATLHDEFGFGKQRCQRFIERVNLKADCLMSDMATWTDYIDMIREEIGIDMVIRRND